MAAACGFMHLRNTARTLSNFLLNCKNISSVINFIIDQYIVNLMARNTLLVLMIMMIVLIPNVHGVFTGISLKGNNTTAQWSLYRESSNFSFDMTGFVQGNISPVETHDRTLSPYQAYYAELNSNDVRLSERTSSMEGNYRSADEIAMKSIVYPDEILILVEKPAGSSIYTVEYKNEVWPVHLKASRDIDYTGRQINDRDLEENNGDYISTSSFYNSEYSAQKWSVMNLQRMNATVMDKINVTELRTSWGDPKNMIIINDSFILGELKPTKYMGYRTKASTTGITDMKYKIKDYRYDFDKNEYPTQIEGEERYVGSFDIAQTIEMRSSYDRYNDTDEKIESWLPCCYSNWNDFAYFDQKGFRADTKDVFDCACNKET